MGSENKPLKHDLKVILGNEALKGISSVEINEMHSDCHTVSVHLYFKGGRSDLLDTFNDQLGEVLEIVSSERDGSRTFSESSYIVNRIDFLMVDLHHWGVTISGESQNARYDQEIKYRSYLNKSLMLIIQSALEGLEVEFNLTENPTIPYLTQYQETDWDFVVRLCRWYGLSVYWTGEKVFVGKPIAGESIPLSQNVEMQSLSGAIYPPALNAHVHTYDIPRNQGFNSKKIQITSPNEFYQLVLNNWGKLYKGNTQYFSRPHLISQTEMDKWHDTHERQIASEGVHFSITTINPEIRLGSQVSISIQDEYYGQFWVARVIHRFTSDQDYYNELQLVPMPLLIPPVNYSPWPVANPTLAYVVESDDSNEGMRRIKVRLPWHHSKYADECTDWIPVQYPSAGNEYGHCMQPQKNDLCQVGFLDGDPDRPFCQGFYFHGGARHKTDDYFFIDTPLGDLLSLSRGHKKGIILETEGTLTLKADKLEIDVKDLVRIVGVRMIVEMKEKIVNKARAVIEFLGGLIKLN